MFTRLVTFGFPVYRQYWAWRSANGRNTDPSWQHRSNLAPTGGANVPDWGRTKLDCGQGNGPENPEKPFQKMTM